MQINDIKRLYKEKKNINSHVKNMILCMNNKNSTKEHCQALIIKQIHAIEKGLSMKDLRLGFGIPRIELMLEYLEKYLSLGGDRDAEELLMAGKVISEYIILHDQSNYSSEEYIKVKRKAKKFLDDNQLYDFSEEYGGVLYIHPNEKCIDAEQFVKLVNSRHSIREFKNKPVDDEKLKCALDLAIKSPSACNRQSTRVYVLDHSDFSAIANWTGGVKTFLHTVDKILIITGQMSAYEKDEYFQYTVSAGIFTGYLTLSLQAFGIGACVLQRSLIRNLQWKTVSQKLGIPHEEQVVCAIAIGVPEDEIKVPKSYRLPFERVVHYVGNHYSHNL